MELEHDFNHEEKRRQEMTSFGLISDTRSTNQSAWRQYPLS